MNDPIITRTDRTHIDGDNTYDIVEVRINDQTIEVWDHPDWRATNKELIEVAVLVWASA